MLVYIIYICGTNICSAQRRKDKDIKVLHHRLGERPHLSRHCFPILPGKRWDMADQRLGPNKPTNSTILRSSCGMKNGASKIIGPIPHRSSEHKRGHRLRTAR